MASALTRAELIALVERIADPKVANVELELLSALLEANVPHPTPVDLIFYGAEGKELTFAEVVDFALAYKPVRLPSGS